MTEWLEEHRGMRGRWKWYFFRNPELHTAKVFVPLAADECPHDNYTVDSVEGANYSRWSPPKQGKDSQYATAYLCCDDCGEYGEVIISLDPTALRANYNTIDWSATRGKLYLKLTDEKTGLSIYA